MSVVIRGFDKPSDCDYCTLQDSGYCNVLLSYINVEHGIDTRCPITEISGYTLKNGHRVIIGKTEQTDTEIAKAIVHKMIDDAVIAEDAYPDLRQKMHDAVDEYEPQTGGNE